MERFTFTTGCIYQAWIFNKFEQDVTRSNSQTSDETDVISNLYTAAVQVVFTV